MLVTRRYLLLYDLTRCQASTTCPPPQDHSHDGYGQETYEGAPKCKIPENRRIEPHNLLETFLDDDYKPGTPNWCESSDPTPLVLLDCRRDRVSVITIRGKD